MTTLPRTLAMIAMLVTTTLSSAQNADFNNDNTVDAYDLVSLTENLNQSCDGDCPNDLNSDGLIDSADIMILMGQWGPVGQENNESSNATQDLAWQTEGPALLDAIYYDSLSRNPQRSLLGETFNQGALAKEFCAENNIAVQPMVYNGGVDYYEDGVYCDVDKEKFKMWLDANVPSDYSGPLCLDMEGEWWMQFNTTSQEEMDPILDFYIEGLEYAQSLRPNAKIGYWGLPKKCHTNPNDNKASVARLLNASTALFPDVYEHRPNIDDSDRLRTHIEITMSMVEGKVPVYVQASPRYKSDTGNYDGLHSVDEFMRDQVDSALAAVWTDGEGKEHRIQGIELWDAYVYFWWYTDNWMGLTNPERVALWSELDEYHVECLENMKASVDLAYAAQQQRNAAATAEAEQATARANQAVQVAAAALDSARQAQTSRLTRRLDNAKNRVINKSKSYRSNSKRYRSARKAWVKAKRAFNAAKKRYGRNSKQYKRAIAAYRKSLGKMRASARSFRAARSSYKVARTQRNNAYQAWNAANSQWSAMASASSMLASQ